MGVIWVGFIFRYSCESWPLPWAATYGKTVTIILLKIDTFLLFSVMFMVLGILQKYEINFVSLHRESSSKNRS